MWLLPDVRAQKCAAVVSRPLLPVLDLSLYMDHIGDNANHERYGGDRNHRHLLRGKPLSIPTLESQAEEIRELRARLDRLDPKPKTPLPEPVERYLEMALTRMHGDVQLAANLFFQWTEQDAQVKESLKPIIQEAIERRLAAIPKTEPNLA